MLPDLFAAETRRFAILLALAIALGFFYNLHGVPLFDVDEGAFSQATREMFLRGDFLSTYLNGEPRYDKPILIYWLQAASVSLFGFTEFGFRLPSALAASAWVLVTVWFAGKILDPRRALLAGLMMATSLEIAVMAKAATADALLNLLLAATLMTLYLYLRGDGKRYLYLAAVCAGLGFLTKGPVAVLIPGAVSFLYCLWQREWKTWLAIFKDPAAWGLFALVALPWYVMQYLREGEAFIQGFFFKHNLGRFSQAMESHGGGWWYYLPVILAGVLPFTTLLLKTGYEFGRGLLIRTGNTTAGPGWGRYLALWFVFVLILFSLSATKLPHYIVYGYTGLFILMAANADRLRSRFLALLPALLLLLALPALPFALEHADIKDPFVREMLAAPHLFFGPGYFIAVSAALALVLYLIYLSRIAIVHALIVTGLALNLLVSAQILPLVGQAQQAPVKEAALLARDLPQTVVMWRLHMPSFSVYSGRIAEPRAPRAGELVITKAKHLPDLPAHEVLYRKQGIALARLLP